MENTLRNPRNPYKYDAGQLWDMFRKGRRWYWRKVDTGTQCYTSSGSLMRFAESLRVGEIGKFGNRVWIRRVPDGQSVRKLLERLVQEVTCKPSIIERTGRASGTP